MQGKIEINSKLCKGCYLCVEACPRKLIHISTSINEFGTNFAIFEDKDSKCTACMLCAIMCPDAAIEVYKLA
jgi:2-oxoglutarate ferredoxin oxidoreductase subunit delta